MHFEPLAALAARYAVARQAADESFAIGIGNEIISRLRQLDWLFGQVTSLEAGLIAEWETSHSPLQPRHNVVIVYLDENAAVQATGPFTSQEQLRILAEAFYYTAHRLLSILDECGAYLPGLKPVQAVSIRRIRNNLIEHANRKGGRPSYTFSVSNASGIRLRSAARAGEPDVYMDEGLRGNALELAGQLQSMLVAAVEG